MTGPESANEQLHRLTRLAARLLNLPMAVVGILDNERVLFFSRVGWNQAEVPRQGSLCEQVAVNGGLTYVPDAPTDRKLLPSELQDPALGVRMYAGYPLYWPSGERLGAFCVMGQVPRQLSADELETFSDLGALVEELFSVEEIRSQARLGAMAEEHLRALLQAVPDQVFRLTSDGIFIDYHCEDPDILFAKPIVFLGRHFRDVLPPALMQNFMRALVSAVASDEVERIEYDLKLAGRLRHFVGFVRWLGGEFTVVIRDTTEERELTAERDRLARIVEETQDFCCLLNLTGRVIYLNPYGRALLGIAADEPLFGLTVFDFQDAHDAELLRREHEGLVQSGSFSGETTLISRKGERIPVSVRSVVHRSADNSVDCISTLMRDIRAAKLHELALKDAAEAAQAASRAKSTFLANMSHELRTPLNGIIGFAELLCDPDVAPLTEIQAEFVQHIVHSGKHLLRLVSDILDISKVEAGRIIMAREAVVLDSLAHSVLAELQPIAERGRVLLVGEIERNPPPVLGDVGRIKQILYNLLSNAIKFTPPGGRVCLSLSRDLSICDPTDKTDGGEGVLFKVSDTGIGIRSADLPRLFQEFEQIDSQAGIKPEGTGLGLALSKRLIELHGGTISVESQYGSGSVFTVRLPAQSPRSRAREAVHAATHEAAHEAAHEAIKSSKV